MNTTEKPRPRPRATRSRSFRCKHVCASQNGYAWNPAAGKAITAWNAYYANTRQMSRFIWLGLFQFQFRVSDSIATDAPKAGV